MPMKPPRACRCGRVQPCRMHPPRPAWDHGGRTRYQRGLNAEYDRNRRLVMREEDSCGLCGGPALPDDEADHVIPRAKGGTNERSNLRRTHKACNARRAHA